MEALRASYLLALARRPTLVLVYGPHGVGKTTIVKEFALALGAEFVRTQGRNDLLPSDFIADREPEAGADGALRFPYRLKEDLARLRSVVRPGIWFVDEVDKIPPRSLFALLEPMEEGRITLSGVPVADSLWFLLVATANTKRFDRFASDIPLAERDRFAITLQVGFLSREEDLQVLRASIEEREAHPSAAVFSLPDDAVGLLERELRRALDEGVGACFVDVVKKLQGETKSPGQRAYIAATHVYAALRALGYGREEAEKAAAAWCIAPRVNAANSLDATLQAYEQCPTCTPLTQRRTQKPGDSVSWSQGGEPEEGGLEENRGGGFERERALKEDGDARSGVVRRPPQAERGAPLSGSNQWGQVSPDDGNGAQRAATGRGRGWAGTGGGGRVFPRFSSSSQLVEAAAQGRPALTSSGRLSARLAGEMLASGALGEVVAGGVVFRAAGGFVVAFPMSEEGASFLSSVPAPSNAVKRLSLASPDAGDYEALLRFLRDYGFRSLDEVATMRVERAGEVLLGERMRLERGLPVRAAELKLFFDAYGAALRAKASEYEHEEEAEEGELDRIGEYRDTERYPPLRLDVPRSARNILTLKPEFEYRRFVRTGRRYVFCVDTSGSMESNVKAYTRLALAAAVCAAVAEADAEASFGVVAFNTEGSVVLERGSKEEAQAALASLRAGGGTSYPSGLAAALEAAEPGDAVVVVGDYEDDEAVPPSITQAAVEKSVRFYFLLAGEGHESYAEYLAGELGGRVVGGGGTRERRCGAAWGRRVVYERWRGGGWGGAAQRAP